MKTLELNANTRTAMRKGSSRALRREGSIPAILYGPGSTPVPLAVPVRQLEEMLSLGGSEQFIVKLNVEGGDPGTRTAMIKELQRNPVSRRYLHADFYEIAMDRKLTVKVPISVTGMARGIEMNGLLQVIQREIEISCLPGDVPKAIEVDVTNLDLGDSIHLRDIAVPEHVDLHGDPDMTIATVVSSKMEEVAVPEGEGARAEATESGQTS